MSEVLGPRALNRAILERQHLLERRSTSAIGELEHLVGMQAQSPNLPYVGLWSRLRAFDPTELGDAIEAREAVRIVVMRGTIHLVSARDCLFLRSLTQPVLTRTYRSTSWRKELKDVDIEPILAEARELATEEPRTPADLGRLLAESRPGIDPKALSSAVNYLLPMVQVPPRGVWGKTKRVELVPAEHWLGRKLDPKPSAERMIRRYLAAFGPASVMDVQAWCGLTRLREVTAGMDDLRSFSDEEGKELLDLPDAPLPDPDTPAPARFLPEYDNVTLAYANRTRVLPEADRGTVSSNIGYAPFLSDGFLRGFWKLERDGDRATMLVEPFRRMAKGARSELAAEAERLLGFVAADADPCEVRFVSSR